MQDRHAAPSPTQSNTGEVRLNRPPVQGANNAAAQAPSQALADPAEQSKGPQPAAPLPKVTHPNVYAALAAAQGEFPPIPKTRIAKVKSAAKNIEYQYSYANLSDIHAHTLRVMARHGLGHTQIMQVIEGNKSQMMLRTVIFHETGGDTVASDFPIPAVGAPQEIGVTMSYMRRYAFEAAIGVASGADVDGEGGAKLGITDANGRRDKKSEAPPKIDPALLADWVSDIESADSNESLVAKYRSYYVTANAASDTDAKSRVYKAYTSHKSYIPPAPKQSPKKT